MICIIFWTVLFLSVHLNYGANKANNDVSLNFFEPLTGVGVNIPNLFWERLEHKLGQDKPGVKLIDGKNPKHSFSLLKSKGIDLVRFAASPYCQSEFSMWRVGGSEEATYWEVLDEIIHEAKQTNIRLVVTLIWRPRMPSFSCREPFKMLFQSEKPSCARTLIRLYATDVISRYQDMKNIIVAWELFNEMNLEVDLKLDRSKCHWDPDIQSNVCKDPLDENHTLHSSVNHLAQTAEMSKEQANLMVTTAPQCLSSSTKKIDDSHSCNCMGWASSEIEDNISSRELSILYRDFASWVRTADVKLKLPISSGASMPRRSSWHYAAGQSQQWQAGSSKQFCDHLLETHSHVELASIHPYIRLKSGTNGSSYNDEVFFALDGQHVKLIDLVKLAQRCINLANRQYPRQLYIGEFGYEQGNDMSRAFVEDILHLVRDNSRELRGTPPLMTVWAWEYMPQHETLSVESERDQWFIHDIAKANMLAQMGT